MSSSTRTTALDAAPTPVAPPPPARSSLKWLPKHLSPVEAAQLLASADARASSGDRAAVRDALLLHLALGSGLRVKELVQLCIEDIDVLAGTLVVREGKRKPRAVEPGAAMFTGPPPPNPRLVVLGRSLVEQLNAFLRWKAEHGEAITSDAALFASPRTGGPVARSTLQKAFKRALARAGLPSHHSIHHARHTYGTFLFASSKNLLLVRDQLGHSRVATTEIYAHPLLLERETIFEGLDALLAGGRHREPARTTRTNRAARADRPRTSASVGPAMG